MSIKPNYNYMLALTAALVLFLSFLFKYGTGSFLGISEDAHRQVMAYEISKRKHDISIPSLKASCYNYELVINELLLDIEASSTPCVQDFFMEIQDQTKDSAYYKIIEKMYEHAYYYDEEITASGREVFLYQNKNKACGKYIQLSFVLIDGEYLISHINYFPEYISCYCKM